MPTSGTRPLRRANSCERAAVEAGDDRHVHVARAPAAALGEQHDRQPAPLGELEQAVLLGVVAHALRARQHGVVVGHRHARAAVDVADAADEPVGGRARDQLLARAPPLLGGEQQRAVLDEACPRRRSSARFSRAVRRPRSWRRATASGRGRVEADLVALAHRAQVGALAAAGSRLRRAPRPAARRRRGSSVSQQLALLDGVADRHRQLADDAVRSRRAPRAPSSSPRARPAARRPDRLLAARAGSRRRPRRTGQSPSCSVGGHRQIIADTPGGEPRTRSPAQELASAPMAAPRARAVGRRAARGAEGGADAGARLRALPRAGRDAQDGRLRRRQRRRRADVRRRGARAPARTSRACRSWAAPGKLLETAARGDRDSSARRCSSRTCSSAALPATATRSRSRSRTARSTCCARSS